MTWQEPPIFFRTFRFSDNRRVEIRKYGVAPYKFAPNDEVGTKAVTNWKKAMKMVEVISDRSNSKRPNRHSELGIEGMTVL
jgi:hypothetical protein